MKMQSRSGSETQAKANLVMTEALDLLASAVPTDKAAGKCIAMYLFFGDVVRLFLFPKKKKKKSPSCRPLKSLSATRDAAGFELHLVSLHTPL